MVSIDKFVEGLPEGVAGIVRASAQTIGTQMVAGKAIAIYENKSKPYANKRKAEFTDVVAKIKQSVWDKEISVDEGKEKLSALKEVGKKLSQEKKKALEVEALLKKRRVEDFKFALNVLQPKSFEVAGVEIPEPVEDAELSILAEKWNKAQREGKK